MPVIKCFSRGCRHYDEEEPDHCSKPLIKVRECFTAIVKEDPGGKSKSFYYNELMSNKCACGKTKKKGHSFCYHDYIALPDWIKSGLYNVIGKGYEEHYEAAVKYLEENVW